MTPGLILSFASLCALVIATVYIIIAGIFFLDAFQYKADAWLQKHFSQSPIDITPLYFGVLLIAVVYTGSFVLILHRFYSKLIQISFSFSVVQWHFSSVMCSVLKKIKGESSGEHVTAIPESLL